MRLGQRPLADRLVVGVTLAVITAVLMTQVGGHGTQVASAGSVRTTPNEPPQIPSNGVVSGDPIRPESWEVPILPVEPGTLTPRTTAKPKAAEMPAGELTEPLQPRVGSAISSAIPALTPSPTPQVRTDYTGEATRPPAPRTQEPVATTSPIRTSAPSPIRTSAPSPTQPSVSTTTTSPYIGHIVQWDGDTKAQKTAWLVGSDGRRRWIPDIDTYWCLKAKGAPGPTVLSSQQLDALPDIFGVWATC